jgi:hypothetical protein
MRLRAGSTCDTLAYPLSMAEMGGSRRARAAELSAGVRGVRRRPIGLLAAGAGILIIAAIAVVLASRSPGQARVSADLLPVLRSAHKIATYVDCSKVGAVAYDEHHPCQTFLLLESNQLRPSRALLSAEDVLLQSRGWRHPAAPVFVDMDVGGHAAIGESWAAPGHQACAYVTTGAVGVRAEAGEIFPYDPYNTPHGVLAFYRTAKASAAAGQPTLWVRLQPVYLHGHPEC